MRHAWAAALTLTLAAIPVFGETPDEAEEIQGAWSPESYVLKDGTELDVDGLIFFTSSDWTVLFFVQDEASEPRRGSAEGGTYSLSGERLTFRHAYHLSAGDAMAGLPEAPLRMNVAAAAAAAAEPCRIELAGDRLVIEFPSGNRMRFRRSSK